MGRISKTVALILTLIIAMSCLTLLVVKPSSAQSTTTPVVPNFTAQYTVNTINVEPTYTTNPYTGQNETAGTNYSYENKSIEVIITNQPFNNYPVKSDGITYWVNLYYDVRYKGHFSTNWIDPGPGGYYIAYPGTQNTTVLLYTTNPSPEQEAKSIPSSGQIDVQVQAFIGYPYTVINNGEVWNQSEVFNGAGSGWSNIQTVTIGQTSSVPELPVLALVPLLLSIFLVAVIVRHRKTVNLKQ
jgi:hypothetical protein